MFSRNTALLCRDHEVPKIPYISHKASLYDEARSFGWELKWRKMTTFHSADWSVYTSPELKEKILSRRANTCVWQQRNAALKTLYLKFCLFWVHGHAGIRSFVRCQFILKHMTANCHLNTLSLNLLGQVAFNQYNLTAPSLMLKLYEVSQPSKSGSYVQLSA